MAVRIRLGDGSSYVVDGSIEDLQQKVVDALNNDVPFIQVRNGNGQIRSISPRLIAALEEEDDKSLTPGEEQILESVQAPPEAQRQ
ncbi:MAG: hypothetical protein M3R70_04115 [Actinomycetota bacterium]|nr:hypothetical protein [Actinomycetota bacterium]